MGTTNFGQYDRQTLLSGFVALASLTAQLAVPFPRSEIVGYLMAGVLICGVIAISKLFLAIDRLTNLGRRLAFLTLLIIALIFVVFFVIGDSLQLLLRDLPIVLVTIWGGACVYLMRSTVSGSRK